MVTTCCVEGCKNEKYPGCETSFFSFPLNKELKIKWKNAINLKGEVGNQKICQLHFRKEDVIIRQGASLLKENAIPIFIKPQFIIECDDKNNIYKFITTSDTFGIGDTDDDSQQESCDLQESERSQNVQNNKIDAGNSRCSCCLHTDKLRSLWRESNSDGVVEIYGSMLIDCFGVTLNRPSDPNNSTQKICEKCIGRLKDAVSFKAEVLTSVGVLNQEIDIVQEIKQEIDIDTEMQVQPEYFNIEDDHLEDSQDSQVGVGDDNLDEGAKKPDDPIKIIKLEPLPILEATWSEDSNEVIQIQTRGRKRQPLDSVSTIRRRTQPRETKVRRRTRPSESIPKKYKQYKAEDVQKAVEAVAESIMSQNAASKTFKVPIRVLSNAYKSYVKMKKDNGQDTDMSTKMVAVRKRPPRNPPKEKKKQRYPEQNLLQAFEEVWNKRMTQTEASKFYKVPRSTIFDMINKNLGKPRVVKKKGEDGPQEMVKHTTNIVTIMESSNATPIRCHGDGGYMCCFCSHRYQKPDDLKNHTLFFHDSKTKRTLTKGKRPSSYFAKLDISYLKCTICNTHIDTLEKFIDHLIRVHQKCMYTDIKNHILPFRFETEELRCTVCNNVYNKFKLLQEHLNVHYQNYVCDVCNAGFVSRMILHNHTRGHKTGVFTCEVCCKVYSTLRKLTYHKNLVHRHSYLVSKCGYCNQKFKSYHRKLEHLTAVHKVKPITYTCKACNRNFNSQAALRIHRKRDHLLERKYKCTECDMEFFARAELNAHMLKHTGLREFQCDVCQKSFKRKFTLTEHMRIHENNCRFKCEHCGAAFVQKCSWRGHMRNKHGIIS